MEQKEIKILPYSYSSLKSFEDCARKHYGEKLSKEFAKPFVKQASDGDRWHKESEAYALQGTPIPENNPHRARMTQVIDELKSKPGKFYAELELAVRKDRTQCGWWDKDCYTRAKCDIIFITEDGKEATSIDWKTGKPDIFSTQLKHSGVLLFFLFPDLQIVHTRYEWLKGNTQPPTKADLHREFMEEYWSRFEKRFHKYQKAKDKNDWPATKNGLCRNYCGVTTCEYHGK